MASRDDVVRELCGQGVSSDEADPDAADKLVLPCWERIAILG
jgi:hypothetical protein